MAKRRDGIEIGGAYRWVESEDDSYSDADAGGQDQAAAGHHRGHPCPLGDDHGDGDADADPDEASREGEHDGYFFHHLNMDRNLRDQYRDSEYYDRTARFIENYDNLAFDADKPILSVELFAPMVRNVFKEPKRSLYKAALDRA